MALSGKHFTLLIICICCSHPGFTQVVEVTGHLKVSNLDTVGYGDTLVLKMPDGTFVIRSAADIIDDISLDQKIMSYFIGLPEGTGGLLDLGESLENLYAAGAPIQEFLDEGVTLEQILQSEIPIEAILDELNLTIDSLLMLYDPLSLFNFGLSVDSLYGKVYQEGFIFYLDTAGTYPFDGLMCGMVDIGEDVNWGCVFESITTDTVFGSDPVNQANILAAGCVDPPEAATLCADYHSGTYDDWILPAKETLNLIYQNLALAGLGNFTAAASYCSSSEASTNELCWVQDFPGGVQSEGPKSMNLWEVRPVRAYHQ